MMVSIQIDYRKLQFIIYQDDNPVVNPLPDEVQRVVIQKVVRDVAGLIRMQFMNILTDTPPLEVLIWMDTESRRKHVSDEDFERSLKKRGKQNDKVKCEL